MKGVGNTHNGDYAVKTRAGTGIWTHNLLTRFGRQQEHSEPVHLERDRRVRGFAYSTTLWELASAKQC